MEYSHIFGSNFPNEAVAIGSKKDVDDSVINLISQYYAYLDAKDLDSATTLYNENKNTLDPYIVDSNYFSMLEEELYNTGLFALNSSTSIISDIEPVSQSINSHWLKEF